MIALVHSFAELPEDFDEKLVEDVKPITEEFSETMNQRDQQYRDMLEQFETRVLESVWDVDYINSLPDSAFVFIEKGGSKDSDGRTTPRSLRHLVYRNAEGLIDRQQLENCMFLCETLGAKNGVIARRKLQGIIDQYNQTAEAKNKIETSIMESLKGKPIGFAPAVIQHQNMLIMTLTEKLNDVQKRLVTAEEFINTIVDPKGAGQRNDNNDNDTPPSPKETHRDKMRKMILRNP